MHHQKLPFFLLFSILITINTNAQDNDEYWKVVKGRAHKIVEQLNIEDINKAQTVENIIAQHYVNIKSLDDEKEAAVKAVKETKIPKAIEDEKMAIVNTDAEEKRNAVTSKFVKELKANINDNQVEKVKDGLTYNVLPITYKAYQDMLPQLSTEEERYIYDALVEAREHAMSAGSSKEKHGWFGKYKGRINNYLSARGYDLSKESKAWEERVRAKDKN